MIIKIIALLIGILILCGGIYYLINEKDDNKSKKIYTITCIAGAVIAAVSAAALIL